jgi:hypothetical protein
MPSVKQPKKKTRTVKQSSSTEGNGRHVICAEAGCRETATHTKDVVVRRAFCEDHA